VYTPEEIVLILFGDRDMSPAILATAWSDSILSLHPQALRVKPNKHRLSTAGMKFSYYYKNPFFLGRVFIILFEFQEGGWLRILTRSQPPLPIGKCLNNFKGRFIFIL